jgi:hypothetical protein
MFLNAKLVASREDLLLPERMPSFDAADVIRRYGFFGTGVPVRNEPKTTIELDDFGYHDQESMNFELPAIDTRFSQYDLLTDLEEIRPDFEQTIDRPLFSKKDISAKFREVGTFYTALKENMTADEPVPSRNQLHDAMTLWLSIRFHIPETGSASVSVADYQKTFLKLYSYIDKLGNDVLAQRVLKVVDSLVVVGDFDKPKKSYLISKTDMADATSPYYETRLPAVAGNVAIFKNDRVLFALGEAVALYPGFSSWESVAAKPTAAELRVLNFLQRALASFGDNNRAINDFCLARVKANPALGLKAFLMLLESRLPTSAVPPVFAKLNDTCSLNVGDNRAKAFDVILKKSDPALTVAFMVLAKLKQFSDQPSDEIVSNIHAKFQESFLSECLVSTLDALMEHMFPVRIDIDFDIESEASDDVGRLVGHPAPYGRRVSAEFDGDQQDWGSVSGGVGLVDNFFGDNEDTVLTILKLPYVLVHTETLTRGYEAVLGLESFDESKQTRLLSRLNMSADQLREKCLSIRQAYATDIIDRTLLKDYTSFDRLRLYSSEGMFRAECDITATQYTEAEKNASRKLLNFYCENDTDHVIDSNGNVNKKFLCTRSEINALYRIASVNKPAFDRLRVAVDVVGQCSRFLSDMRNLQSNKSVQKLICDALHRDSAMFSSNRETYHEWAQFFSATLPAAISLGEIALNVFSECKDSLPVTVKDRVERALFMSKLLPNTALNLKDDKPTQASKAVCRAVVFEFARKGISVFRDHNSDNQQTKSKRHEFRMVLVSCFASTIDPATKDEFMAYMRDDLESLAALNDTYESSRSTFSEAEKGTLATIFPLVDRPSVVSEADALGADIAAIVETSSGFVSLNTLNGASGGVATSTRRASFVQQLATPNTSVRIEGTHFGTAFSGKTAITCWLEAYLYATAYGPEQPMRSLAEIAEILKNLSIGAQHQGLLNWKTRNPQRAAAIIALSDFLTYMRRNPTETRDITQLDNLLQPAFFHEVGVQQDAIAFQNAVMGVVSEILKAKSFRDDIPISFSSRRASTNPKDGSLLDISEVQFMGHEKLEFCINLHNEAGVLASTSLSNYLVSQDEADEQDYRPEGHEAFLKLRKGARSFHGNPPQTCQIQIMSAVNDYAFQAPNKHVVRPEDADTNAPFIRIPIEADETEGIPAREATYLLEQIVVRSGFDTASGHYQCYFKHNGEWYLKTSNGQPATKTTDGFPGIHARLQSGGMTYTYYGELREPVS